MNEPIFGLSKFDEQDRIEKMVDNLSDLFHRFCEDGDLDIAKLFCNKIKKYNEGVTRNGKVIEFNLIKLLDINNELFGNVCSNGHFEVAQWLYSLNPSVVYTYNYINMKENTPSGNIPSGNTPSGNIPSGNTPSGNIPSGNTPSGYISSGNTPFGNTPSGYISSGNTPFGNISSGNTPFGNIPSFGFGGPPLQRETVKVFDTLPFSNACCQGHLEIAQWLYSMNPEMNILGDDIDLEVIIEHHYLDIIQWMFSIDKRTMIREMNNIIHLSSKFGAMNILDWILSTQESQIIRESQNILQNGIIMNKMNVVEWILEIKPDVSISDNENKIFHHVCKKKYLHMAQWFHTRNPDKFHFVVNEDGSITPNIQVVILLEKNVEKVDTCSICLESETSVVTICDHQYCKNCIVEWYKKNPTCAYCRRKLEDKSDLFYIKK